MELKKCGRREFIADISAGAACLNMMPPIVVAGNKKTMEKRTGYAYDPNFAQFGINGGDIPGRVTSINSKISQSGFSNQLSSIAPHENPMKYIRQVHIDKHIEGIQSIPIEPGYLYGKGEIAQLAVAHVLGAVKGVCDGTITNAFCNIRPPGHHVIQGGYTLGYCCYGNVAIAAHYALQNNNINKVLIVDWDYHQGNGTHSLICGNDNILFFETFSPFMYSTECDDLQAIGPQDPAPLESNRINVQMPSGSNNDDFVKVFEEKLVAAADNFHPDLVLISCGFDLKGYDSLGSFNVTSRGVSRLTKIVKGIADEHAGGKMVSMLEGGYVDVAYDLSCEGLYEKTFFGLSDCAASHVATLLTGDVGKESDFYKDPGKFICKESADARYGQWRKTQLPRIHGNMLNWERVQEKLKSIAIFDPRGVVVARHRPEDDSVQAMDLRDITKSKGQFIVKMLFSDNQIWSCLWHAHN